MKRLIIFLLAASWVFAANPNGLTLQNTALVASVTSAPGPALTVAILTTNTGGSSLRSDGGGFTVGAYIVPQVNLTIYKIGRFKVSGDSHVHTLQILSADFTTVLASCTVDMTNPAEADGYVYASLGTPFAATATIANPIGSVEITGQDQFWNGTVVGVTTTTDVVCFAAFFAMSGSGGTQGTINNAYPINIKYTVP